MSWWQALLLGLLPAALWAPWAVRRLRRALHILQLEEYENARALRWARRYWLGDYATPYLAGGTLCLLALIAAVLAGSTAGAIAAAIVFAALGIVAPLRSHEIVPKKALVVTARVKRLLAALSAVMLVLVVLLLLIEPVAAAPPRARLLVAPLVVWAAVALAPLLAALANLLAMPVEALNKRRYRREAAARLRAVSPRIVAITGSFGKTTTKELIATVLEARYRVLKTPASFNTVMGITRVIREQLRDDHEVFVVEMGAYHPGNIRELCRFVGGPDVSALVGINEQHLERFGSIQNTIRTKYEIVEETKPGGVTVINVDNAHCAGLADRTANVRVLRVGAEDRSPRPDIYADAVTVTPKLMRFDVHDGDEQFTVRTRLIGRHLLPNILIALAIGKELGVDLRTAVARLSRVEPVAHRLVVTESDGKLVIDDAYSANVDGARAALALLAELPAQRRLLVTPGIVELGSAEALRNREFGAQAAAICDLLLTVGASPGRFVREGALAAGMPADRTVPCATLTEAQQYLKLHAAAGDAVLFENDLPDNYA
jgi:UDP-N-acetylmuramoyl-tripeptide--D-alanyl-D-alanine ligase